LKVFGAAAFFAVLSADQAFAQGIPLLDSSDTAIAIDLDSVFGLNGRYPLAENPPKAIDGLSGSKYLNFGRDGAGFIVTPSASLPVESFQIRTANDQPSRDPASWQLYGFNGPLITMDSGPTPAINQDGLAEAWTLIDSGSVALPGNPTINTDQRGVLGPVVNVNSGGLGYQHYKMVFPTVKSNAATSIQFDEIQFYQDDAATPGMAILNPSNPIIAVDAIRAWNGSSYPGAENPASAIDQRRDAVTNLPNSKYLNFGEERSGIIITNSGGPVRVDSMGLTTANDAVERDPTSYELWGTNDPISSADNSNSNGSENWTLISSGALALPGTLPNGGGDDFRLTEALIPINATQMYTSYRLIFPTVKDAAAANSMQIEDIQFYTVPEPSALTAVGGAVALLMARRRRTA
jgi:hypothetical protein